MEDQRIKEILIEKDSAFKQLFLEHQQCEQKLHKLSQKDFKTTDEQLEEQRIKKTKIKIKDIMQSHIYRFKTQV